VSRQHRSPRQPLADLRIGQGSRVIARRRFPGAALRLGEGVRLEYNPRPGEEPDPAQALAGGVVSDPDAARRNAGRLRRTYLFLASPSISGYIVGQIIEVNGGQPMP
jgi:NAD(P)-dependent dehydrogenase (short-subunit alcohol dehydrogenase family)